MSQILRNGFFCSALALIVAAALPACSGSSEPTTSPSPSSVEKAGGIGLELTTPGGVVINTVSYTISGNGITPIPGTIKVDSTGATSSVFIGALPASASGAAGDYTVTMNATGVDGVTTCTGASAPFKVTAGTTVSVTVPLTCGAPTVRGNVKANGEFNSCPVITSMIVSPLEINLDGVIDISAAASDTDGNPLTFAWTSTVAGVFGSTSAAATTYTCKVPGTQTLTATVSDGAGCLTTLQAEVLCKTAEVCGNNTVGVGEQCDPPAAGVCSDTCQNIAIVCGNSIVQPGEQCDPPNGTTCDTACKNIVCGDGVVAGSEQCDPPAAGKCSATCQNAAVCGDSIVGPGEVCDDGNTVGSDLCSADCKTSTTPDLCGPCTTNNCSAAKAACDATNPACQTILDCIKTTKCAAGSTRDGAECYCGPGIDNDTCFNSFNPAVPQGVCKAQIEAAAGSNIPLSIGQIFFDLSSPVGSAFQTTSCQLSNCTAAPALACGFLIP